MADDDDNNVAFPKVAPKYIRFPVPDLTSPLAHAAGLEASVEKLIAQAQHKERGAAFRAGLSTTAARFVQAYELMSDLVAKVSEPGPDGRASDWRAGLQLRHAAPNDGVVAECAQLIRMLQLTDFRISLRPGLVAHMPSPRLTLPLIVPRSKGDPPSLASLTPREYVVLLSCAVMAAFQMEPVCLNILDELRYHAGEGCLASWATALPEAALKHLPSAGDARLVAGEVGCKIARRLFRTTTAKRLAHPLVAAHPDKQRMAETLSTQKLWERIDACADEQLAAKPASPRVRARMAHSVRR
jgi:hypothetical protein